MNMGGSPNIQESSIALFKQFTRFESKVCNHTIWSQNVLTYEVSPCTQNILKIFGQKRVRSRGRQEQMVFGPQFVDKHVFHAGVMAHLYVHTRLQAVWERS